MWEYVNIHIGKSSDGRHRKQLLLIVKLSKETPYKHNYTPL